MFISFLLGFIIGLPLPILAIQILLIDLGVEVLPSIALSFEPEEEGVMSKKPRNPKRRIMDKNLVLKVIMIGSMIGIGSLFLFYKTLINGGWYFGEVLDAGSLLYLHATTITFASIMMFQMVNAFNAKTETESVFKAGIFKNIFLLIAVASSILMTIAIAYFPFFNQVLHTAPLTLNDWEWIIGFSLSLLVIEEIRKFIVRTYQSSKRIS